VVSLALTWPRFGRTWPGAASQARDDRTSAAVRVRFQPAARRAIAQHLPEAVAAAVLEFCDAALAVNPQRVGKPLFGPLAGCHGARRGTYRIVYRIDESSRVVHVSMSITARRSTTVRSSDRREVLHARGTGQHQA
jgi:mRNA-degrading endonuclease RelE of RelBE toxin-antitoxin system